MTTTHKNKKEGNMNRILILATLGIAAASTQTANAIPLSDNLELLTDIGMYSEYAMRGISFSQRKPVLQGYATLAHSNGMYAGVLGSNVDFGDNVDASYEADYYVGYMWQATDNVSIDLGYIKYTYPRTSSLNASETYAVLKAYNFKLGTYYSGDYYGHQSYMYNYIGYTRGLALETTLDLRYGFADYKDPKFVSANGSTEDSYREWEVKLTEGAFNVDWSVSYIDTNLSESECLSNIGDQESCSARLLFSVSKTF